MDKTIWEQALNLIKFDPGIDKFTYDSVLKPMKVAYCEDNVLVLEAKDDYCLTLAKGESLGKIISTAIRSATNRDVKVSFVKAGDNNAITASVNSSKKVIREENSLKTTPTGLNGDFTFANFVVGDCNRFAHASAVSVADKPGQKQRNPFFLWGNSGLGKTHLMKAIGNSIIANYPKKKVIYTTCEAFVNDFVACGINNSYEAFRKKYRTVDVLLIDDIQFLIKKEVVQTEFFNTFETLIDAGKQIVITCDKAPSNLVELDNRLTSRFQDGIMFDVQPPDFETRKAIILKKLEGEQFSLSDEVIDYICENITTNIRQLNGAFNTISSYVALASGELSLEEVQKILLPMLSPDKKKYLTPEIIINAVAKYYDLPAEKITSNLRSADISTARNVAMYICRDYLELKLQKIGDIFGGRKHTTVMHGCNNVDEDPELKKEADEIIKLIT
ncbi:MAG: chromosomal replication initiator protein DnaA [Saccharofermentans sp.]|nr:chromosomal replication initiator protein DnaA [Saccharofermentans sp.]